ncbi:hypothetical protein FRC04_011117 [Tulasnella sp. 424]|nr:hypothetical protein FRC04_011117 [Tulasnella sp. 424]
MSHSAEPNLARHVILSLNIDELPLTDVVRTALYPGRTELNILRTIDPSLSTLRNISDLGDKGSVRAQLWYNDVETFYCQASNCTQSEDSSSGAVSWQCDTLSCTCIPGSPLCGANPIADLTKTINSLGGTLGIKCDPPSNGSSTCSFVQDILKSLFGANGLQLSSCTFGECVQNAVVTGNSNSTATTTSSGGSSLGGGVIAGLAVVGALLLLAVIGIVWGWLVQRKARAAAGSGLGGTASQAERKAGVGIEWVDVGYTIQTRKRGGLLPTRGANDFDDGKVILNGISGRVQPGEMMAILGPSGAGKTSLIELLAGKNKDGIASGALTFFTPSGTPPPRRPRIGFVDQTDILPSTLTVKEALLFAARLRLPESVSEADKAARVFEVMQQLGISDLADMKIGGTFGQGRGVSGGEMRRISIGLELVARPEILILDEPTSGLDSASALKVATVLQQLARDPDSPTTVIASIHQPSSQLYRTFDQLLVLSKGRTLYSGAGGAAPTTYFASRGYPCPDMYNPADHLLDLATAPPSTLTSRPNVSSSSTEGPPGKVTNGTPGEKDALELRPLGSNSPSRKWIGSRDGKLATSHPDSLGYPSTFLTQLEVLSGREWTNLKRDKSLFIAHFGVAAILGVFCGGLYYNTGITIAGFQSRVGCLFFLGSLISFMSLSALYNIVEIKPLFLRERAGRYYSPSAWLLARVLFDVIPLRIIPTIVVSTITYWMAGLSADAARFFKFLLILVLFSLAMALYNFLLACTFSNGGIAILLSALFNLFTMTFAGFFVHLDTIPPVLRWLQWLCPLKYCLEALSVNEVGSGLMIQDSLQGVPVNISAQLIMTMLFGFGPNNYYRDVLVIFAFVAGFAVATIGTVWWLLRERR